MLAAVALLFAWGATPAPSASAAVAPPTWTHLAPTTSPTALWGASLAFDAATNQLVLFGGTDGTGPRADTWVWDGSNWTQLFPPTSPSPRIYASMAFDAATNQLVLFGGCCSGPGNDTWTWDGSTWTQVTTTTAPSGRDFASLAFDGATNQLVLFGGNEAGGNHIWGDTWTWDGSNWTQRIPTTSPPARLAASMAFDAATNQLVLFGGYRPFSGATGDTWIWDGSNWIRQFPATSPSGRESASIAFDADTRQLVLFGGERAGAFLDDTWVWTGATWTQRFPVSSPSPRSVAATAFDGATNQLVVFSGLGSQTEAETWVWGPVGASVPAAPAITATARGSHWASVAWTGPTDDGGSPITGYTVIANPGGATASVGATTTRAIVEGLTNDKSYTFTVRATNVVGPGAESSASAPVVPVGGTTAYRTTWDASEKARVKQTAAYLGQSPARAQRTAVEFVAYLLSLAPPSGPTPVPPPSMTGTVDYTTSWTAGDQQTLVRVAKQYALTPAETQKFAMRTLSYVLALGGH